MKASILDLRRRMSEVLKALERNEDVTILYRGKKKGIELLSLKALSLWHVERQRRHARCGAVRAQHQKGTLTCCLTLTC